MKFIVTFSLRPEHRDAAIARFRKTGGLPPKPARFLGRWTAADMSGGFVLIESEDVSAVTEFALMWTDLIDLRVIPVIEDESLTAVLSGSCEGFSCATSLSRMLEGRKLCSRVEVDAPAQGRCVARFAA